jgi:hypothetical protein
MQNFWILLAVLVGFAVLALLLRQYWDVVTDHWWSSLLVCLASFGFAGLFLWVLPTTKASFKVAGGAAIVGLCFAVLTVINWSKGTVAGKTATNNQDSDIRAEPGTTADRPREER